MILPSQLLNKEQANSALIVWSATRIDPNNESAFVTFSCNVRAFKWDVQGLAMPDYDNSLSRCRRSRTLLRKIPFCPSDTHTAIALLLSEYIPTTDKAWVFPDWLDARLWLWQRPVSTVSATARLCQLSWIWRYAPQEGFGNPTILEQGPFDYIWSKM